MLFVTPKTNDKRKESAQETTSSTQPITTDTTTWLSQLGCHVNSFYGDSIVANSANISIAGTLQKSSQRYWYQSYNYQEAGQGFLARYNPYGQMVSAQTLSLGGDSLGLASMIANNDSTFVSGVIHENGYVKSIWTAKFNWTGDLLWAKTLMSRDSNLSSYSYHSDMFFLTTNHYAIVSTAIDSNIGSNNAYTIYVNNLDDAGNVFWEVAIKNDTWRSVSATAIGSSNNKGEASIVGEVGYDCGAMTCYTPFIAMLSRDGALLDSKQFFLDTTESNQDWGLTAMSPIDDQDYFTAGTNAINGALLTLRMDSNGQPLSATQLLFDNAKVTGVTQIALAMNANYAIVGVLSYGDDGYNACLIGLFDEASKPIWITVLTHAHGISCIGITNSKDGGFLVTGATVEKTQKNPTYYSQRAITIKTNTAGFVADLPSEFTYNNFTNKYLSQPVTVYTADLTWATQNQTGNASDITSSISISDYASFCAKPQTDYRLLLIYLSLLIAVAICRLGWQDEKRKVKAPWQASTSDDPTKQQQKLSIDSRKSSLSGGLFGRSYERFSRGSKSSHVGGDILTNSASKNACAIS